MVNSINNPEHYVWCEGCEGWHLYKSDSLSVIEERMPPNTNEVLHYHEKAQQVFYIPSGTKEHDLLAGEFKILFVTLDETGTQPD